MSSTYINLHVCAVNNLMEVFYVGYLCDNIGLVLVCLPSGSTDVAASPSRYMIQPSGIPILSPALFMQVGDPFFNIRRIFDLLVSPPFLVSLRPVAT